MFVAAIWMRSATPSTSSATEDTGSAGTRSRLALLPVGMPPNPDAARADAALATPTCVGRVALWGTGRRRAQTAGLRGLSAPRSTSTRAACVRTASAEDVHCSRTRSRTFTRRATATTRSRRFGPSRSCSARAEPPPARRGRHNRPCTGFAAAPFLITPVVGGYLLGGIERRTRAGRLRGADARRLLRLWRDRPADFGEGGALAARRAPVGLLERRRELGDPA